MMKMKVERASCRVEFDYVLRGSVLRGTVNTTWEGVQTTLEIDSEEPPEKIAQLIRNAKGGCFAENMFTQAVPLRSKAKLNGEPLSLEGTAVAKTPAGEDKPIPFRSSSTTPGERLIDKPELPKQGFAMHLVADTETIPGEFQLRLGKFMKHEIYADEGAHIGGENRYPPPMSYVTMGVGF
ncbi:MAG: hypothetical protein HOC91_12520 [Nitrospinaceae bacterium]|jgi:hypothetical protein|nr:hypothetical protein [Nitrospinaceae bacterium]MBT4431334.1 hypothetical protein [Nitrospinaceae bacterium]MBT5367244.1 hypothetical protein [Nitrospinaceae bacterium]MBT5949150.1 hypothetical protein [Nitrospinaceae bacterium]